MLYSGSRGETVINSGDTAWVLISAALVVMMTPAVGFFYGGMVRRKSILSTIMMCFPVTIVNEYCEGKVKRTPTRGVK